MTGLAAFFEKSVESSLGVTPQSNNDEEELKVDPFTIVLPIIVLIFDFDLRRVYRKREKWICLIIKLLFWAFFYTILGFAAR